MTLSGKVVVLYNDLPGDAAKADLDVLFQVGAVADSLERMGFDVSKLVFSSDAVFTHTLLHLNPVFIFNLVETVVSLGRWSYLAPAWLEKLGIPYTGCPAEAVRLTTDKIRTKEMLKHAGLPTPAWVCAASAAGFMADGAYIMKPVYEDASVGLDNQSVRSFHSAAEILSRISALTRESNLDFFAEKFIEGREFSVSILGEDGKPNILTPLEVCFDGYEERNKVKILDYNAKWESASFEYQHAFSIPCCREEDSALLDSLRSIAEKCWTDFHLRGYARIDFRVDQEGNPWVIDINANPCLTPGESSFLKAAQKSGLDFQDVIRRICREAGNSRCLMSPEGRCGV